MTLLQALEASVRSLNPLLLQGEQAELSQPLLTGQVLQTPPSWWLPLNSLQFIDVFPASECPKLGRVSRCDVTSAE